MLIVLQFWCGFCVCVLVWVFWSWTVLCFILCLWVDISKCLAWRMFKVPSQAWFYSVTTETNRDGRTCQLPLAEVNESPEQLSGALPEQIEHLWEDAEAELLGELRDSSGTVTHIPGGVQAELRNSSHTSPGTQCLCPVSAPGEDADVRAHLVLQSSLTRWNMAPEFQEHMGLLRRKMVWTRAIIAITIHDTLHQISQA